MIAWPLFLQICVLFLIMFWAFALVRLGILKSSDSKILSVICVYIIIPCISLNAFQITYTPDVLQGFLLAAGLAVAFHILLFIYTGLLKRIFHLSDVEHLSVMYSNAGNLVIPLVASLFGEEWIIYASAYSCVQLFFMWTHAQSVMSGVHSFNWKKIVTNINLLAVLAGFLMFLLHIQLPYVMKQAVSSLAVTVGPVTMIMLGMLIGGTDLKILFRHKRIYLTAALRLIAVPLMGILVLRLVRPFVHLENTDTILLIVLFALMTPSATTIVQLSQFYDNETLYSGAINVATTILCIFTMPLMAALFTL